MFSPDQEYQYNILLVNIKQEHNSEVLSRRFGCKLFKLQLNKRATDTFIASFYSAQLTLW